MVFIDIGKPEKALEILTNLHVLLRDPDIEIKGKGLTTLFLADKIIQVNRILKESNNVD